VDGPVHRPTVELVEAFPAELEAGASIGVSVRASCVEGCDLRGAVVSAVVAGEVVAEGTLAPPDEGHDAPTVDLVLTAPGVVGPLSWTIGLPEQEIAGVPHESDELSVGTTVLPHTTSVAVWGVPSPLKGSRFAVRVGIKCSAGCSLAGQLVKIWDESGRKLGEGSLAGVPRPGTAALYEAEVSLVAPSEAGVFSRSATFDPTGLGLPHGGSAANFTFRSLEPPQHTVTVALVPKGLDAPLGKIEVFVGPYVAETDAEGVARVGVPKGTYEVSAWRVDLEPASTQLEVTGDTRIEVEVEPRRVEDEDADRHWA
jgi:hypothetical protein